MDSTTYDVIFDLLAEPYEPPLFPIVVGALGAGGFAYFALRERRIVLRVLFAVAAFLSVIQTSAVVFSHFEERTGLQRVVSQGRAITLEGPVRNFRRDPLGGNGPQTFQVLDHSFVVWGNDVTAGFRATVSRGGPDLADRCVRVMYVPDTLTPRGRERIVWLGIRRSGCG